MCPSVPRLWAVWRARTKRTVVSAVCLTATSTPLDSAASARPTPSTSSENMVSGGCSGYDGGGSVALVINCLSGGVVLDCGSVLYI